MRNVRVLVYKEKHYIIDLDSDNVTCVEDALELAHFGRKLTDSELTGTFKVNRILRNRPN